MHWLAEHGFPSATPIADRDGATAEDRARQARRHRRVPARPVGAPPDVAHCREAGEGLGWLHWRREGFPGRRANDLGQAAWARLFAPLAGAAER